MMNQDESNFIGFSREKMMNNPCKGCHDINLGCIVKSRGHGNECPCASCLLKGICYNICEDRTNYAFFSRQLYLEYLGEHTVEQSSVSRMSGI